DADRGDDRNEVAAHQHFQQVSVNTSDFTHLSDIDDLWRGHFGRLAASLELLGANQLRILAGQADSAAAVLVDQADDALVDLAAEHHFHHIHGLAVGHAHAVDEAAFDIQPLEQIANLRTAAMHDHRIDADGLHQHDVAGEAGFQLLAFHRVAAVLDHQRFADESANVG